jgi:hypothetical protein
MNLDAPVFMPGKKKPSSSKDVTKEVEEDDIGCSGSNSIPSNQEYNLRVNSDDKVQEDKDASIKFSSARMNGK